MSATSRKNGRKTDGKCASGNPGRPKGSRHKTALAIQALLDGEGEALTRKAIDIALAGDGMALCLCLERIVPPRKDVPVIFDIPRMETARDAAKAAGAVIDAVASGDLTPTEGARVMPLVEGFRRTLETSDLEVRVMALGGG